MQPITRSPTRAFAKVVHSDISRSLLNMILCEKINTLQPYPLCRSDHPLFGHVREGL